MSSLHLSHQCSAARHYSIIALFASFLFLAGLKPALAQIGNNNPTGPAGVFNGSITTGCGYDPATGNATRQITDLSLPSVGAYPLAFTRISNSRATLGYAPFSYSGSWEHSYDWVVIYNITNTQKPSSYEIIFPDGRDETFTSSGAPTSKGIRETVIPLNTTTMLFYLVLPDGGKVEFSTTRLPWVPGYYEYYSIVTALIDPYGQRTAIAYDGNGNINQITEPGGRYIQLSYVTLSNHDYVDHITGSDGRTVQYSYTTGLDGNPALTSVTYFGDSTIKASYTYQPANVGPASNFPLLATADDPMYAGRMKKIS
jgi:YD repeat-containing protein